MTILIILFFLIVFSIALRVLFNFKMEQSLFIVFCSIIIILFIFGLFGILSLGYIVILCLGFISSGYAVYVLIKYKEKSF